MANHAYDLPMQFSDTILVVSGRAISLLELTLAGAGLALFMLLVIVIFVWRLGSRRHSEVIETQRRAAEMEVRLAELSGQLRNFADTAATRETQMSRNLDERLDMVSHRLGQGLSQSAERTSQSLQNLYERLAVIDVAQQKITDLSSEMLSLKDILANKQTRGAYGQARMEAIIRDGLHSSAYSFQATLSNGKRPDCLVKLPESDTKIVIDAKFPLEAFNAMKSADDPAAIALAEKQLRRDVMVHIKDIADKYLISGETHETAIMFVPSESIYADLHEHFDDLIQKAHRQRVIITSPNIMMLLVQTMQAIFKDARMREQASLIQKEVVLLLDDVGRLNERIGKLQSHFQMTAKDLDQMAISTSKITRRGEKIEQMELQEDVKLDEVAEPARPKLVAGE